MKAKHKTAARISPDEEHPGEYKVEVMRSGHWRLEVVGYPRDAAYEFAGRLMYDGLTVFMPEHATEGRRAA